MDDFAQLMRRLMTERGLGVRALARAVPCDHALISRLLSGRQSPSPAMARQIDELLHACGRLSATSGAGDWELLSGSKAAQVPGPLLVHGVLAATSADMTTGRGNARFSPDDAAARANAVLTGWGSETDSPWPTIRVLTSRQIGMAELKELEATADEFRRWGHQFGGGIRRKAVVGQLNEVACVMREPHPYALRRRLFGVTAKLALVAGHMSADNGDVAPGFAYRYLALAMDAARESGEESLAARVVNATARQLVTDGRVTEAVALIEKARQALRHIGPDEAALLVACQAWAYAHLGRSEAVSKRLDQVEAMISSQQGGTALFGPAELAGIGGACFETLACKSAGAKAEIYADHAARRITVALSEREPFYVRSRVLDLLGLATVRLVQKEPGEAVRTARMALESAQGLRSTRVSRRYHWFAVSGLERFPKNADVAGFAEQVRATIAVAP